MNDITNEIEKNDYIFVAIMTKKFDLKIKYSKIYTCLICEKSNDILYKIGLAHIDSEAVIWTTKDLKLKI